MKNLISFLFVLFLTGTTANAAGNFGLYVGSGLPYLGQVGANFMLTDRLSFSAGYNVLDLEVDNASAELTMPEVMVNFHPFGGSFFIGAGVGQESLEVKATDDATSAEITFKVDAMTTIAKLGWMWGADDGGFWYGIDLAYIMPSGADVTIDNPNSIPTTDQDYQDAEDAADKFGETAYPSITFLRLGFLF